MICPGCNQTIHVSVADLQRYTECGGEDEGACSEANYATDLADLRHAFGEDTIRRPEWEAEGPEPPDEALCARILEAHRQALQETLPAWAVEASKRLRDFVLQRADELGRGMVTLHEEVTGAAPEDLVVVAAVPGEGGEAGAAALRETLLGAKVRLVREVGVLIPSHGRVLPAATIVVSAIDATAPRFEVSARLDQTLAGMVAYSFGRTEARRAARRA